MKITFIREGPLLLVQDCIRVLVVADLHFGIESEMARHGLHIRSRGRDRMERLLDSVRACRPDRLVILGDLKHRIPYPSRQERLELPELIEDLRDLTPLSLTPGNHDGGIEHLLASEEICPRDGVLIDGVGYLHGHTYPSRELAGHLIIAGHHHPLATLEDEVGCALRAPVYLFSPLDPREIFPGMGPAGGGDDTRVLFMPAFNEMAGYDIRKIIESPFSPLSRAIRRRETEVFMTDGTLLGPLDAVVTDEHQ